MKLRIAYLTTKYPSVSHTFIRREIREIEGRGHTILRLALRPSDFELSDPLDRLEASKTIHCLTQPFWIHAISLICAFSANPYKFFDALRIAVIMGFHSERGVFKHFFYLLEACTFLRFLNKHSIDHVHVHFGTNIAAVARLIKRCGGPSYSFTVHGPAEFDSPHSFDLQGKIHDSAFVVAITDYCRAQLMRWSNPSDWNKIHIVGCSVGDDFFAEITPIKNTNKTFVSVGRLTPQKGQLILLDAFSKLISSGHHAKLILVGDGELRKTIEHKINIGNLSNHVRVTGFVSEYEVRQQILSSRTLVLPSFAEGLPMVIMEAFAVGRPVISTFVAGIPELVRHKENGWLVPAGNIEDLTQSLIEALSLSPQRLSEMAAIGKKLTYKYHHTKTEGNLLERLFFQYIAL